LPPSATAAENMNASCGSRKSAECTGCWIGQASHARAEITRRPTWAPRFHGVPFFGVSLCSPAALRRFGASGRRRTGNAARRRCSDLLLHFVLGHRVFRRRVVGHRILRHGVARLPELRSKPVHRPRPNRLLERDQALSERTVLMDAGIRTLRLPAVRALCPYPGQSPRVPTRLDSSSSEVSPRARLRPGHRSAR
jgi:hypothetical protein